MAVIHGIIVLFMFSTELTVCVNLHVFEAVFSVLALPLFLSSINRRFPITSQKGEEQLLSVRLHNTPHNLLMPFCVSQSRGNVFPCSQVKYKFSEKGDIMNFVVCRDHFETILFSL